MCICEYTYSVTLIHLYSYIKMNKLFKKQFFKNQTSAQYQSVELVHDYFFRILYKNFFFLKIQ